MAAGLNKRRMIQSAVFKELVKVDKHLLLVSSAALSVAVINFCFCFFLDYTRTRAFLMAINYNYSELTSFSFLFLYLFLVCHRLDISLSLQFWVSSSKGFCRQKRHFSFVRNCKFRQKFCNKCRISSVFRHPKMRHFQQCITVTAVNLFYEVLPKQFEAFGFYFSQGKHMTAEYWVS